MSGASGTASWTRSRSEARPLQIDQRLHRRRIRRVDLPIVQIDPLDPCEEADHTLAYRAASRVEAARRAALQRLLGLHRRAGRRPGGAGGAVGFEAWSRPPQPVAVRTIRMTTRAIRISDGLTGSAVCLLGVAVARRG